MLILENRRSMHSCSEIRDPPVGEKSSVAGGRAENRRVWFVARMGARERLLFRSGINMTMRFADANAESASFNRMPYAKTQPNRLPNDRWSGQVGGSSARLCDRCTDCEEHLSVEKQWIFLAATIAESVKDLILHGRGFVNKLGAELKSKCGKICTEGS